MLEMSLNQRESIGFRHVLEALAPCSAYGAALVRGLTPFRPGQEDLLRLELDNVGRAIAARPRCTQAWERLERVLMQIKDIRKSIGRCGRETLSEIELFEIKRFLIQLSELGPLLDAVQAEAGFVGIALSDTLPALALLDPEGSRVASFYVSERYSPALAQARREKRALEERLRLEKDPDEMTRLQAARREQAVLEEQAALEVQGMLSQQLGAYRQAMLDNCDTVGKLDLTLQKAKLAMRYHCCKPEIGQGKLELTEMVNPALADHLADQGKTFVPVTLELAEGVTVITGANMGGKSVALKAVALNVLAVSCGLYAFAQRAQVCLFDQIFLMSEDLEDSGRGLSSFGGEIVGLTQVVDAVEARFCLVLMDEFARGTNPHEGAALARAVVRYLSARRVVCAMTTHYDGVADAAGAHYQVIGLRELDLAALGEELRGLGGMDGVALIARHMNYGLYRVVGQQGLPRDALNVCRLLALEPDIIRDAERTIGEVPS